MANLNPNPEHLATLKEGVDAWNQWRQDNPAIQPDLRGAKLKGQYLPSINFNNALLERSDLEAAVLCDAKLQNANLHDAHLYRTDFCDADLRGAVIRGADLVRARLIEAKLQNTDLRWVKLSEANLRGANITGSAVYGISAWEVNLDGTKQLNLSITRDGTHTLTVDRLEVAQFVHILQDYKKLQDVLNSVMQKGVLLLGRFREGGIDLLRSIAEQLRVKEEPYLPIIFEFDKPDAANYTETVQTLAGLSKFVIVDLSGPSTTQELQAIVPHRHIPFVPIIEDARYEKVSSMYSDFLDFPSFLVPIPFSDKDDLLDKLDSEIIEPALKKLDEMLKEAEAKKTKAKENKAKAKARAKKNNKSKKTLKKAKAEKTIEITKDNINTFPLKPFRESLLHARLLTEEDYAQGNGTIRTSEGPKTFRPGDYLAQGVKKETWLIAQQEFNKLYRLVSGIESGVKGFAAYRNDAEVQAYQMSEPFIIKPSNGYDKGNRGDYVVRSGDKIWAVACDNFERHYERPAEKESKMETLPSEGT